MLTHRFWTTAFQSDPSVIGKTVRLGDRSATIVGVLEPSVPYPTETEIIANVVTSPHHLDATMVDGRVHRMTDLFGRLAPGADLDAARAELRAVHGAMVQEHPEAYRATGRFSHRRGGPARSDHLTGENDPAGAPRGVGAGLHRRLLERRESDPRPSVRREGELAIRAALGASAGALRRTLLAESLLLCGAGAILAVVVARPMVAVLARYAARFSVRALDVTVDASLLWVGAGLAVAAAVLLAFVPRLPSADASNGLGLSNGGVRITSGTNRRLRLFAVTQIAASFVLLAGAGMLLTTLFALQRRRPASDAQRARGECARGVLHAKAAGDHRVLQGGDPPHHRAARRGAGRGRHGRAVARSAASLPRSSRSKATPRPTAKRIRARGSAPSRRDSSPRSAYRSSPAAISTTATAATAKKSSSSARAWRSGCSRARTP